MSGKFTVHALPGPDTTPTTRLRLENKAENICAHLSAMTARPPPCLVCLLPFPSTTLPSAGLT